MLWRAGERGGGGGKRYIGGGGGWWLAGISGDNVFD